MRSPWTTSDEIKFIAHLRKVDGKPWLEGYLAGFQRRANWGDIDRDTVYEALLAALNSCAIATRK